MAKRKKYKRNLIEEMKKYKKLKETIDPFLPKEPPSDDDFKCSEWVSPTNKT